MAKPSRLVWQLGSFPARLSLERHGFSSRSKRCFIFKANAAWGISPAGKFMRDLYENLGKPVPYQASSQLAICETPSGFVVGIGVIKRKGQVIGFDSAFLLTRTETEQVQMEGSLSHAEGDMHMEACEGGGRKVDEEVGPSRVAKNPVLRSDIPSGTYKAPRGATGGVCPTLPLLTNFEMDVWEGEGQQVALVYAEVEGWPLSMRASSRLVWHCDSAAERIDLEVYGLSNDDKRCFHFMGNSGWGVTEAGDFMHQLYASMGKRELPHAASHLIFCKSSSRLLVGVELNKPNSRTTLIRHAFFLDWPTTTNAVYFRPDSDRASSTPAIRERLEPATRKRRSSSTGAVASGKRPLAPSYDAVSEEELPSGTYTTKELGAGRVCSSLPRLTDFELRVWENHGQQVACVYSEIDNESVCMSEEIPLVWDSRSYSVGRQGRDDELFSECFRPQDNTLAGGVAGTFLRGLYSLMGMSEPPLATEALAFCPFTGSSDILVLIGLEGQFFGQREFEHSLVLSRPQAGRVHGGMSSSVVATRGNADSSFGSIPDGDYGTSYEKARIGVGIQTNPSTGRRVMKLELRERFRQRAAAYSGVAVPTADNYHHGFTPDKVSICYTDRIGWALNFHKQDTSDGQTTTALELKRVGNGEPLKNGTGGVCSSLPLLTNFGMEVWADDGKQVARANATIGTEQVPMSQGIPLVWYSSDIVRKLDLRRYGLPAMTEKRCFHFSETGHYQAKSTAGEFMQRLYSAMGKSIRGKPASNVAFCRAASATLVAIGVVRSGSRLSEFENTFLLERQESNAQSDKVGNAVASASVDTESGKRKRPTDGGTPKGFKRLRKAGGWAVVSPSTGATNEDLPSEAYVAARQGTGEVCPSLQGLADFGIQIWEEGGQQVALVGAKADDEVIPMRRKGRLKWYSKFSTSRLSLANYTFSDSKRRCFHLTELGRNKNSDVGEFVKALYHQLGHDIPSKKPADQLVFCNTTAGLLVGMGIIKDLHYTYGFDHSFLLTKTGVHALYDELRGVGSSAPVGVLHDRGRRPSTTGKSDSSTAPPIILADGDYETSYGTVRIGVSVGTNPSTSRRIIGLELLDVFRQKVIFAGEATPTTDNCMDFDLPAHSGSLSLHAIRSFLGQHGFAPDKISICYSDRIGWALSFHKQDTSDGQTTTALELSLKGPVV
ncbi:hypothetical protein FOZ61_007514 [Perkinsus olseni]|nr:hypothetical protein FOZ61_007514 [Perkinsus olseni]